MSLVACLASRCFSPVHHSLGESTYLHIRDHPETGSPAYLLNRPGSDLDLLLFFFFIFAFLVTFTPYSRGVVAAMDVHQCLQHAQQLASRAGAEARQLLPETVPSWMTSWLWIPCLILIATHWKVLPGVWHVSLLDLFPLRPSNPLTHTPPQTTHPPPLSTYLS